MLEPRVGVMTASALTTTRPSGLAVLNADKPWVADMASQTAARTILYDLSPDADFRAEDVRGRSSSSSARARYGLSARRDEADDSVPALETVER